MHGQALLAASETHARLLELLDRHWTAYAPFAEGPWVEELRTRRWVRGSAPSELCLPTAENVTGDRAHGDPS